MQRIRDEIRWMAPLGAFTLVFFRRLVTGEALYFGDFQGAFEPLRTVLGRSWRDGLPLWNRWLGSGQPLLANPVVGALYPPNLLFALPVGTPARTLTLLVVAHLLWGGIGAGLLARRLGAAPVGALVAALVFSFCAPEVQTTYTVILTTTAAWLPWVVLAFLALRDAPPQDHVRPAVAFGVALAAMLLSSEPFTILSAVLGCAGLLVHRGTAVARTFGRAAAGAAIALLIVSPQVLATFRTLPSTVRAGAMSAEGATEWSMAPLDALGFLLPDLFGEDFRVGPHAALASFLTNRNATLLDSLYVGPLCLALALAGLVRRFPGRAAFTAWLVLLLCLALGRYGFLYPVFLHVPAFAVFRYPYKWLIGAMLPLALLAGVGSVPDPEDDARAFRRRCLAAGAVLLVVLGLVSWGAGAGLDRAVTGLVASPGAEPSLIHAAVRHRLREAALQAALPLAAALLALVATPARLERFLPGALAALVAADLFFGNRSLAPSVDASFYTTLPQAVTAIRNDPSGHGRVWVDERASTRSIPSVVPPGVALTAEVLRPRRERLDAYSGASYGLELAFNMDVESFSTSRYAALRGLVEAAQPREMAMLLAAAGVTHAVTLAPLEDPRFRELARVDVAAIRPLRVLRVGLPASRVRVVGALVPYRSPRDVLEVLARSPEDLLQRAAFIAEDELARLRALPRPGEDGRAFSGTPSVAIVREDNREVEVECLGPGGFLLLADSLAPGWTATVDGAATPIFAADVAFRMVLVPPGRHAVVFRYAPWS